MNQKTDNQRDELLNLMVGLTHVAIHDTKKLNETMKNLSLTYHTTDDHSSPEMLIPKLQIAFRELSHNLIQIRSQTRQLQSIINVE